MRLDLSTMTPETQPGRRTTSFGPMSLALKRRHFLQSMGAVGAVSMLPLALADMAEAATPVGPSDGILLLITMNGGCDALDLVVPINDGTYYSKRSGLAVPAGSTHQIDANHGLHPELGAIKTRWDAGQVAVIEGVGDPAGNLSHFDNMARIMAARTGEGVRRTGWLGRYIDGLAGGNSAFHGVSFGGSVPLDSQGARRQATALRANDNNLVNPNTADDWERNHILALQSFGQSSTGRGEIADLVGRASYDAVQMAYSVAPLYSPELPEGDLAGQMVMAARLINANLGIRVFSLNFGDFDGHANHRSLHDDGMRELNQGIEAFFSELAYGYLDQVMVLTTSEFGRRVQPNRSGGTDHGSAATYLAIGTQIKGGIYGAAPSLTDLDEHRNMRISVDYRAVYGTVLDRWLNADSGQILGGSYEDLDFTHAPASVDPGPRPSFLAGLERRDQIIRLYLAYFLRMPDTAGLDFWIGRRIGGASLAGISTAFAESPEFRSTYGNLSNSGFAKLVYQNVLGREPDSEGLAFWTSELDRGVSRGNVMIGFSDSAEYRTRVAPQIAEFDRTGPLARLYYAYFLRSPDREGRDYWNSTGKSVGEISQAFSESAEFTNRYGALSNTDFVALVYRNVLDREPEPAGHQYWTRHVDRGLSRGAVMVQFSESPEFVTSFTAS